MKNILRNNLWMMIVAWCLMLNNYSLLSIVVGALASLYLSINVRFKNYWRVLAIYLICFSFSLILANLTVFHLFKLSTLFLGIVSLNVALLNERLKKERMANLFPSFIAMFVSLIICLFIAILLPANMTLANAKANLYALIILIFIPYTSEVLISLLVKEYNMKRFLDKVKTSNSSKMYN